MLERRRIIMRIHIIGAGAALLLMGGSGIALGDTIIITPEQQTVIHDYVVQQHFPAYVPAEDVNIEIGSTLPDTVELHEIDTPGVQQVYSYVLVDGRTVLVDPATRRIVQIIN
jgi:hypothetical protein